MKKKRYDLILGLGSVCSCTQTLRQAGLQHLTFPFDWITSYTKHYDVDVSRRTDQICDEFADWFDRDDFVPAGTKDESNHDHYLNKKLEMIFIHDFDKGVPYEESFPVVKRKYRRRIDRLLQLIRKSENVLLVRVDRIDIPCRTPLSECRYAVRRMREKFAPVNFDLVLLTREIGRPFRKLKEEHPEDGITVLAFDYKDPSPGVPDYQPIFKQTVKAFSERFAVRDYRTPEEIAAHAKPKSFWRRLFRLR